MASIHRVRKQLRKALLHAVSSGQGDIKSLKRITREIIGNDVGIERLLDNLYANEVSKAMAVLRSERLVETVGKVWKLMGCLDNSDVDTISLRRLKRLRGELRAQVRLAHEHGRTEDAILASDMLGKLTTKLEEATAESSSRVLEPSMVKA